VQQFLEQVANLPRAARADVERPACRRGRHHQVVGVHHIAHVGHVPARVKIPHQHLRRVEARLDPGDLPREARDGKRRRLPGAGVIERAGDHDIEPVFRERAVGETVLRELGQSVGC